MKTLILALSLLSSAWAQSILGPVCPATVKSGGTLICSIVLAGGNTATTGPAGLQWTITTSQATGTITAVAAGTGITAGKTVSSNTTGTSQLVGINAGQIADGTVATITIPIPQNVSCPGNSPCFTVMPSVTRAATIGGSSQPITPSPLSSVFVSNSCDVNGDGQITSADVVAEQAKTLQTPPTGDLNQDGMADVIDVQIIINAVRGQACTAL